MRLARTSSALVLTCLFACAPAIDESSLPDVPRGSFADYQPLVREQLDDAHRRLEQKPLQAQANGNLGMLYRAYRDFDAAAALFARARALAPRNADWAYYHGETLEQQADYAGALLAINAFLEREPDDIPGRLRAARLHIALNQIDQALGALEPLYREANRVGDVHVAYAQALARAGRHGEAAHVWERAIAQFGSFKMAHYALAQHYRRVGDEASADRHQWLFSTVVVEEPPVFDPRLAALLAQNRSDRTLLLAAQAAKRAGNTDEALVLLEEALTRAPDNIDTIVSLILGYGAASNIKDAQRYIERGMAIDAANVDLGLAIARLRLQQGRVSEARQGLLEVTQRSPQHAVARTWLGRAYELGGDASAAGEMYAQAVAIDPQELTARRFYARWLIDHAPPAVAQEALAQMVLVPARDEPRILSALAQTLVKLDRPNDALDALSRAIERAQWQQQTALAGQLKNQRARLIRQNTTADAAVPDQV